MIWIDVAADLTGWVNWLSRRLSIVPGKIRPPCRSCGRKRVEASRAVNIESFGSTPTLQALCLSRDEAVQIGSHCGHVALTVKLAWWWWLGWTLWPISHLRAGLTPVVAGH